MFHQIVYQTVDIDKDLYFTPLSRNSRIGNSKTFIRLSSSNCNQLAYSFFPWSVNHWDRLPSDIVNKDDNLKFKAALCDHLVKTGKRF